MFYRKVKYAAARELKAHIENAGFQLRTHLEGSWPVVLCVERPISARHTVHSAHNTGSKRRTTCFLNCKHGITFQKALRRGKVSDSQLSLWLLTCNATALLLHVWSWGPPSLSYRAYGPLNL